MSKTYVKCFAGDYAKGYADAVFKRQIPGFVDDQDSFLILDEVQESEVVYNHSRQIVRGLDAKVAFAGSFLGDAITKNYRGFPLGDVHRFIALSATYREFVNSLDELAEYRSILDFTRSNPDAASKKVIENSKLYWDIYYELGGFPGMLLDGLQVARNFFINARADFLSAYVFAMSVKTQLGLSTEAWAKTIGYIITSILCRKDPTDPDNIKAAQGQEKLLALMTMELVYQLMGWMEDSRILRQIPVRNNLETGNYYMSTKSMFTSYGLLCQLASSTGADGSLHKGVKAETFVLNELLSLKAMYQNNSLANYYSVTSSEEIDFVFITNAGAIVLVEVKNTKVKTIPSQKALERGDANFLIKIFEGAGFVQGNTFTLPIYNVDRLSLIIHLIDIAFTNNMTLEEAFARYVSGIEDIVIKHDDEDEDEDNDEPEDEGEQES
ncbi:MAG: DUF4143 domain-containing protein [Clostridiales bacterium]|nr:DUF4143 domain-containing protein [Clostridiales bacterium]